jgi:hypothetical protein
LIFLEQQPVNCSGNRVSNWQSIWPGREKHPTQVTFYYFDKDRTKTRLVTDSRRFSLVLAHLLRPILSAIMQVDDDDAQMRMATTRAFILSWDCETSVAYFAMKRIWSYHCGQSFPVSPKAICW